MFLAAGLFSLFTVLATLSLFLILRHHYGLKTAIPWSLLVLAAFVALGWWVYAIIAGSGLG
jgi:hypothetical protein